MRQQIGGTQHVYVCFFLRTGHVLPLVPLPRSFPRPDHQKTQTVFLRSIVMPRLPLGTLQNGHHVWRQISPGVCPPLPVRSIMSCAVSAFINPIIPDTEQYCARPQITDVVIFEFFTQSGGLLLSTFVDD